MGKPAARVADTAGHGGIIMSGEFTVIIEGQAAARRGDQLTCPASDGPKPHVGGNIVTSSMSVIIGGAYAARMGDDTGCGVMGVSGAGMPGTAGPAAGKSGPDNNYSKKEEYGYEDDKYYNSNFGTYGTVKGSAYHRETSEDTGGGYTKTTTVDGGTVTMQSHHGAGSAGVSTQVAATNSQIKTTDRDGNSLSGTVAVGTAQAGTDILMGTDGRRTGVAIGGALQASGAEVQADSTAVIPIPFTDSTFNVGATGGVSALSLGAAANAGAYHDAADNRFHLLGMIDVEALIGVKLGLDFSIGPKGSTGGGGGGIPGVGVPAVPGKIVKGASKTFIG